MTKRTRSVGRPFLPANKKKQVVPVRLESATLDYIDRIPNKTRSQAIRDAINGFYNIQLDLLDVAVSDKDA